MFYCFIVLIKLNIFSLNNTLNNRLKKNKSRSKSKMNIDKFIAKYPPESIDIQQLFDITVFYSRFEDVKYLLQHYKNKISIDLCNVMDTEVFKVIVESLKIGQITISKTKSNLIKFNSKFIPIRHIRK